MDDFCFLCFIEEFEEEEGIIGKERRKKMAFSMKKMIKEMNKVEAEMKATSGFARRLTRHVFRERMIKSILAELDFLPLFHIDRKSYEIVLNLLLKGESYEEFLCEGGGTYFVENVRFMENSVYKEFGQPFFCDAENCDCFYGR